MMPDGWSARTFAACLACLVIAPGSAATTPGREAASSGPPCSVPDDGEHRLDVDGAERSFVSSAPEAEVSDAPWPLVVALHGTDGTAGGFGDRSGVAAAGTAAGALIVLPQGVGDPAGWQHDDRRRDIEFVDAVIDAAAATGCVDTDRVWLTGVSAGSALAGAYICARPDAIAGAVLVAGLPPPCDTVTADVYVVHGTADDIIPYGGGDFNGIELATMPEVVAGWAAAAGCDVVPSGRGIEPDVFVLEWTACGDGDGGAVVRLYSVIGGGHGWFTDGAAAVDATCLVVAGAAKTPGSPSDMSGCEG